MIRIKKECPKIIILCLKYKIKKNVACLKKILRIIFIPFRIEKQQRIYCKKRGGGVIVEGAGGFNCCDFKQAMRFFLSLECWVWLQCNCIKCLDQGTQGKDNAKLIYNIQFHIETVRIGHLEMIAMHLHNNIPTHIILTSHQK